MRLIKFTTESDLTPQVGLIDGEQIVPLASGPQALSAILHADDFLHKIQARRDASRQRFDRASIQVNAPIDSQEVWAQESRMSVASRRASRSRSGEVRFMTRSIVQPAPSSSSRPPPVVWWGRASRSGFAAIVDGAFPSRSLPW